MTWKTLNPMVRASQVPALRGSKEVLLIHFGAVWNAVDQEMDRRLFDLASTFNGRVHVVAVDLDDEQNFDFAAGLKVMANPTLACSVKGREWKMTVGLRSREELQMLLEQAIAQSIGQ